MTQETPLGKPTKYADQYDPGLLFSIPRAESRRGLGLANDLPFNGVDIWTAWELSWLDPAGVPQVASAELHVPAYSPRLVESKSLKLYLGSFAMTRMDSREQLRDTIERDLNACTASEVQLLLHDADESNAIEEFPGQSVDNLDTRCEVYDVDPGLLVTGSETVSEALHSHLLRSLCPVTDQPDMGSVLVRYEGPRIDAASLLRYIVSYRQHNDFHEACVERMFMDILTHCEPKRLTVYARYQRRGGIDINPFRSNFEVPPGRLRLRRQ